MTGGQANFLQALGWAVLNSLWQMALLWVVYQVVTGLFRKTSASTKSSLATSFLFAGFAWFLYTFINTLSGTPGVTIAIPAGLTDPAATDNVQAYLLRILPYASVAYLVLLAIPLLHFIRNYRYVGVIRRYGLTKIHVDWRMFVQQVAAQMGIRKKVTIWISSLVSSPVTIGFLKPVILVPLAALNQLTPQQLEAVLLHELAHIRRFDYLVNLLINLIRVVLYFNPFVKAFVKSVERDREKSCDELVLQFQYDSYDYASALLALEKENRAHKLLALASGGKRNDLLHRVETILGVKKQPGFSFNRLAGIVAGLLLIISFNTMLIIGRQTNSQENPGYAHLSSPFSPMTGTYEADPELPAIISTTTGEKKPEPNPSSPQEATTVEDSDPLTALETMEEIGRIPAYINVNYSPESAPELNKRQEQQVKEAIAASRKVLENEQWKVVEDNLAEVFTEKEKAALKSNYRKAVSKFDWKKWENNLRMAYGKVDWDRVNYQLDNAVKQITIDSLHKVYNDVMVELSHVQKELTLQGMKGIPDTDISLKEVELARREAKKALGNLKSVRNKKIAHL